MNIEEQDKVIWDAAAQFDGPQEFMEAVYRHMVDCADWMAAEMGKDGVAKVDGKTLLRKWLRCMQHPVSLHDRMN